MPDDRELLVVLARRVRDAGLFGTCAPWYRRRLALLYAIFVGSWAALLAQPPPVWFAIAVLTAGLASVQLGVIGHDAGHHAVSRRGWINELCGQLGMSVVNGLGFRYWRHLHDLHHRHCHVEQLDPDIEYGLVFSVYPEAAARKQGLARIAQRWQAYTYWILGATGYPYVLRARSLANLVARPAVTRVERWALLGHLALWLVIPALVVGIGAALLAYAAVSVVVGVYLTGLFSVGHLGRPTLGPRASVSYLRHQLQCARDVEVSPIVEVLFGGLNYQIEHHLFPSIAAPNLAAARRLVEPFCRAHGLPHETCDGLLAAQREVLAHLARMARLGEADPAGTHQEER